MAALNRRWYGARVWCLVKLPAKLACEIFSENTQESIKSKRRLYDRKIRDGIEPEPIQPDWYTENLDVDAIRNFLNSEVPEAPKAPSLLIDNKTREYLHKLLDKTLDDTNIDPSAVSKFHVTAGTHEGYIKNNEGELEYTRELRRGGINLIVEPQKFEPKWPLIQQATLATIKPVKAVKKLKKDSKTCLVLPDPQIGYRRFGDGTIDPFHDEKAISIVLQVLADLQPDKVVCLGDFLDLPMFGRFEQSQDYSHTAQLAVDYGYKFLAKIRATVPEAEIVVLEGNHDRRIQNNITAANMSAFGIKRAGDVKGWPVMSVPFLCNFDSLDVKYVEGYPAGKYWINDRLQCIHGHIVAPPGQTAAKVVKAETVSTIFGHVHRIETAYDTQNVYNGARANLAHTPGCLCRIDGGVPSAKGSTNLDGRPIISYENWQHGFAVVDYQDGDAPFSLHSVYINTFQNYHTTFNNKVYLPDLSILS